MKIAAIILNRNLPDVTDALYKKLKDNNDVDIFVVEAGSENNNLSQYCTWHADWDDAKKHGLRFSRGMNFGLSMLWKENKFKHYDAFFLMTNDLIIPKESFINKLTTIMTNHKRLGILSACGSKWGERYLLDKEKTKYFSFIHNNAFMLRREFIECIINYEEIDYMNFLFDGSNFRGYGTESELIAKGYNNDWAAAITTECFIDKDSSYLLDKVDIIKTESYNDHLKLYVDEGRIWMRKKYGFNSHWSMQQYTKFLYDNFFKCYPEYIQYNI